METTTKTVVPELTPEQLEAARAILAEESTSPSTPDTAKNDLLEETLNSDNTYMSEAQKPNCTISSINPLDPAPGDSAQMIKFKSTVAAALVNPDFNGDSKKVEKATLAATMPNSEDRVRAQLKAHAEKTLRAKAAVEAERTGVYVAPTQADFDAHVEKGLLLWREKQLK